MKTAARIIGVVIAAAGLFGAAWPAPLFTLNEPWLSKYVKFIYWLTGADYSCGTALAYLWLMLTMPLGLVLMGVAALVLNWGKR